MTTAMKWRAVVGWEGAYEVSNTGMVRSVERVSTFTYSNGRTISRTLQGKVLVQTYGDNGHLRTHLYLAGRARASYYVHRLVLTAFVGPAPAAHMDHCCHKDGDPEHNEVSNLYWGTKLDNYLDSVRHGTANHLKRTHCRQGHEFTPENTYPRGSGGRICRACNTESQRRSMTPERRALKNAKDRARRAQAKVVAA